MTAHHDDENVEYSRETGRWIPASILPQPGVEVLAYAEGEFVIAHTFEHDEGRLVLWYKYDSGDPWRIDGVTHWMKLPEEPK